MREDASIKRFISLQTFVITAAFGIMTIVNAALWARLTTSPADVVRVINEDVRPQIRTLENQCRRLQDTQSSILRRLQELDPDEM